jgi:hypothetical protein
MSSGSSYSLGLHAHSPLGMITTMEYSHTGARTLQDRVKMGIMSCLDDHQMKTRDGSD